MKLYKSLIMEIRPRLQSVNVFIILNINVEAHNIKVNLNCDHFEIVLGLGKEIVPCGEFRIIPESLSGFSAQKNFVSFRFSTENLNKALGSSRFEIITHKETTLLNHDDIFIKPNVFYTLTCANCTQSFCQKISFDRVLPLPENPDSSDWFCHAHHDNATQSLAPKTTEAFYSHSFAHVNENLLTGLVKTSSNLICKRCLAWIGTILKTTHKIWFNTIVFNDGNNRKSCALDDVFQTIVQISSSSLLSSSRIVLSCLSSQNATDFVLLWVLEKKLRLCFDHGGSDGVSNADVAKVLFKFDKNRSNLVGQWLNDVNVSSVDVSKPMMVKLLEHLYDMNRYIPKDFSISNDFYVSYLMMYKVNGNK